MSNSQQNLSQYEMHDIICECHLCANKHTANIQKMRDELDTYIQMMNDEREAYIKKYVEQYNKIQ